MRLPILLTLLVCGHGLYGETFSAMLGTGPKDPTPVIAKMKQFTYPQALKFLEDNYSEYHQTGNVLDQAGIETMYSLVPPKEALCLVIDCDLRQNNLDDKDSAIEMMRNILLRYPNLTGDVSIQSKIITSLKTALSLISKSEPIPTYKDGNDALLTRIGIANNGASILAMLGDDAGLDIWLTDSGYIKSLSREDKWNDPDPNHFTDLTQKYAAQAKAKGVNGDNDFLKATYYKLCFLRKQHGVPLTPQHPLVSYDALEGEREKEKMPVFPP